MHSFTSRSHYNKVNFVFSNYSKKSRRYLKRISTSHKEKNSESGSLQPEKNDPELELIHALETQERSITFSKKPGIPTGTKAVKELTRWAFDAAGNTGQYIKYFFISSSFLFSI